MSLLFNIEEQRIEFMGEEFPMNNEFYRAYFHTFGVNNVVLDLTTDPEISSKIAAIADTLQAEDIGLSRPYPEGDEDGWETQFWELYFPRVGETYFLQHRDGKKPDLCWEPASEAMLRIRFIGE